MTEFYVDVLQVRKDAFLAGEELGRYWRDHPMLDNIKAMTKESIDMEECRAIFRHFDPVLLEELEGMAAGVGISYAEAAALFSGYDVPKAEGMGCSALLTPGYYVRNYDFTPAQYEGVFLLQQTKDVLASAGYTLQQLGRHDGVNEAGVVIGLHFVSHHSYREGVSPWLAVRMVLDQCRNAEEAVDVLKEVPHAACYNFSVGDDTGARVIVEASPGRVVVHRSDDVLGCSNHFDSTPLMDRNRKNVHVSQKRKQDMEQLVLPDQKAAFDHFRNPDSPQFFHHYREMFGTLHTFSYHYETKRILTTIARSHEVLDVQWEEWVRGTDIDTGKMRGRIIEGG